MTPPANPARLVLASASPRRRELMRALDVPVELASPGDGEGSPRCDETPRDYVLRLSLEKARRVAANVAGAAVLAADTAVVLDREVLGKPTSGAEATLMLRSLRGRVHEVVTGVTVLASRSGRWVSSFKATQVLMRAYSDEEVAAYVASGEPFDKAGGYAIQCQEFNPVQSIVGCYLNVVGLPLCEVVSMLEGMGVTAHLRRGAMLPGQCKDCPLGEGMEGLSA